MPERDHVREGVVGATAHRTATSRAGMPPVDQRLRHQPGPQRDAVRRRIAGRHSELERIAGQRRRGDRKVAAQLAVQRGAGERAGEREKAATVHRLSMQLGEHPPWIGHGAPAYSLGVAAPRAQVVSLPSSGVAPTFSMPIRSSTVGTMSTALMRSWRACGWSPAS